jgi:phospholipid/cholesterol/gamma-HCH transport system permease protein
VVSREQKALNFRREHRGGRDEVILSGRLEAPGVAGCWDALDSGAMPARVDASGVESVDGAGLALLWVIEKERGGTIAGLRPEIAALLRAFDRMQPEGAGRGLKHEGLVESVGRVGAAFFADLAGQVRFVGELSSHLAACALRPGLVRWRDMWMTAQRAGVDALVVAGMVSFLTGMIMAFQSAVPLRQFGVDIFVVNLVALALLRELGPIMTAVVLAGRSGSAFAAEIGTMKVNEELNALATMGLDPVRFLVVPRVLAGFVVTPVLTVYANLLGIVGGFVVMMSMGFPFAALWNQLVGAVSVHDVLTGIIKSFVFGVLVAGIGCLRGLQTGRGPESVGAATTSAVVSGIFLIVVVDAIFAVVFYVLKW